MLLILVQLNITNVCLVREASSTSSVNYHNKTQTVTKLQENTVELTAEQKHTHTHTHTHTNKQKKQQQNTHTHAHTIKHSRGLNGNLTAEQNTHTHTHTHARKLKHDWTDHIYTQIWFPDVLIY